MQRTTAADSGEVKLVLSTVASFLAIPATGHGPLMTAMLAQQKQRASSLAMLRLFDPLLDKPTEIFDVLHCTVPAKPDARARLVKVLRLCMSFRLIRSSHAALRADPELAPLLLTSADAFFVVPAVPRFAGEVLCCGGGGERARALRESCCVAIIARAKAAKMAGEPHCQLARDPSRLAELLNAETPEGRLDYLFAHTPASLRAQLQLDADVRFMVTDEASADRITEIITRLEGVTPHTVVFDGTACIGGNTLSLAKSFATVVSIESDVARFAMLTHNCNVLEGSGGRGDVKVRHGDCLEWVPKLARKLQSRAAERAKARRPAVRTGEFVVFLDPPRDGISYRDSPKAALELSGVGLPTVVNTFLALAGCLAVIIKLAATYDTAALPEPPSAVITLGKTAKCIILGAALLPAPKQKAPQPESVSDNEADSATADCSAESKSSKKKRKRAEAAAAAVAATGAMSDRAAARDEADAGLDDIFGGLSSAKSAAKKRAEASAAAEANAWAAEKAAREKARANRRNMVVDPIFGEAYETDGPIDPNSARVHRFDRGSGLNVYKAHALGLGHGGGTALCPFDCTCCF